jgi:hypothetical protein
VVTDEEMATHKARQSSFEFDGTPHDAPPTQAGEEAAALLPL